METNLLTHQIATTIQELARPKYQGDKGLNELFVLLDEGLREIGSDVVKAGMSEYRKLYHGRWTAILERVCEESLRETLADRFKKLVF
ncbi:MAG: hypothetical protein HY815_09355 [Candidatus Riflebacteria bacterium]|nr:hypothetical protein [Candidatus Riflebacteria bacterium]